MPVNILISKIPDARFLISLINERLDDVDRVLPQIANTDFIELKFIFHNCLKK